MPSFGFCGPTYQTVSPRHNCERSVNLFPEVDRSGNAKSKISLVSTPGLATWCTLPKAPLRALWGGANRLFAVGGDTLYEVFDGGIATARGSVGSASTPAQIVSNGSQLLIVSGDKLYIDGGSAGPQLVTQPALSGNVDAFGYSVTWVSGDKFDSGLVGQSITIGGFPYTVASVIDNEHLTTVEQSGSISNSPWSGTPVMNAIAGDYIDSYFLALGKDTNCVHISSGFDGSQWDPLDWQKRISAPDRLMMLKAHGGMAWLFGQNTGEIWYHSGNADFPFERVQGANFDVGIWDPWSVAELDGSLFWRGGSSRGAGAVYRSEGYTPRRVSNPAVEYAIGQYAGNDGVGYAYEENGHMFYVLSFPNADRTWCYDVTTDMWHERLRWDGADWHAHRGRFHAFAALVPGSSGQHFVGGGDDTGKIYVQAAYLYNEDGAKIRRYRQAPHVSDENKWAFHHKLTLDMEMGTTDLLDTTPVAKMKYSNDGGHTFGSDHTVPLGTTGQYTKRAVWRRLGRSRDRVYGVSIELLNSPVSIVDAYLDASVGTGA